VQASGCLVEASGAGCSFYQGPRCEKYVVDWFLKVCLKAFIEVRSFEVEFGEVFVDEGGPRVIALSFLR